MGMVAEEEAERRDVVGGSGPYREAATTLASATLRATDTHNHLVFLFSSSFSLRLPSLSPVSLSLATVTLHVLREGLKCTPLLRREA